MKVVRPVRSSSRPLTSSPWSPLCGVGQRMASVRRDAVPSRVGGDSAGLLSSSGLEECGCAGLCHISIGVFAPWKSRPTGFHHEFRLFVGRRDGPELVELLALGSIDLLVCETDRYQRRRDRGISPLDRSLVRSATRRPASPTETDDHGENATDYHTPDAWFEPPVLHLHDAP